MLKKHKYDIAISVAEEDIDIAKQIAVAFEAQGVSYYLYTEHKATNWGRHILKISLDTYGAKAKYVLMITSKIFAEKYWANIESQVSQIYKRSTEPYILQLRIDKTVIDGVSNHIVFEKWENNSEEIAAVIKEKLRLRDGQKKAGYVTKYILSGILLIACVIIVSAVFIEKENNLGKDNTKQNSHDSTSKILHKVKNQYTVPYKPIFNSTSHETDNTNGSSKKFIPGGSFIIDVDNTGIDTSLPKKIIINSFYISKTEVTTAEYNLYCFKAGKLMHLQSIEKPLGNYPVTNITWNEAVAYCKWVGGRLPTEAEWEYAASGGLNTKYSGGNNASLVAVYGKVKPAEVAKKNSNIFGLYDMTGNVAEWCSDWYDSTYNLLSKTKNPSELITGSEKVVKGGAYNSHIKPINELAITYQSKESPDSRRPFIGFRVAWDK